MHVKMLISFYINDRLRLGFCLEIVGGQVDGLGFSEMVNSVFREFMLCVK